MERPPQSRNRANRRILVVEDNDLNQRLFKNLLEENGYETCLTRTGLEAVKLAHEELPDLVLMDDQLPGGISGLEAARRIRDDERTSRIPIIAVCSFFGERAALDSGCDIYISKPINVPNFVRTIGSLLSEPKDQDDEN